ncbi:hypothetical protein NDU88_010686 [Pleurodeles waltl]|uniref:Uncharacterized protein n=1 Tax=Pleurodeles waltl TaxID=8319 RepID=A0AAV7QV34_PLEWA|nr:hypothetical protein NDU88_010686 [Pleurodeles waltl]
MGGRGHHHNASLRGGPNRVCIAHPQTPGCVAIFRALNIGVAASAPACPSNGLRLSLCPSDRWSRLLAAMLALVQSTEALCCPDTIRERHRSDFHLRRVASRAASDLRCAGPSPAHSSTPNRDQPDELSTPQPQD